MQRRAAAVYFVLFVALAAGAFGFIEIGASEPEVALDGQTFTQGDSLTVNGQNYTVTAIEAETSEEGEITRSGELTWFNASRIERAQLENDSTVQYRDTFTVGSVDSDDATFAPLDRGGDEVYLREGEEFYHVGENTTATVDNVTTGGIEVALDRSAMLANNSTVAYDGGTYRVLVPEEANGTFTLANEANPSETENVSVGDAFDYQGEGAAGTVTTTVDGIEEGNVTLVWTESATLASGSSVTIQQPYRLPATLGNESVTLAKVENVTAIVANDPGAEEVLEGDSGQFVRLADGSSVPVAEYLPPNSTITLAVGDGFYYVEESEDATIDSIGETTVNLAWDSPQDETIDLGEGTNVTLGPAGDTRQYFAHFPENGSVQILPSEEQYSQYQSDLSDIEAYESRINGLWGIVLVSLFAGIVLFATAYLPNKG